MKIIQVHAYEVLNSIGFPTVACIVQTDTGAIGKAVVPNGRVKDSLYYAKTLYDHDENRYFGRGVKKAVNLINRNISNLLLGLDVTNQKKIDQLLNLLDSTPDKSFYGANTLLVVSLAVAKAAANELHIPLYQYIRENLLDNTLNKYLLPVPFMKMINGGRQVDNTYAFQEYMIVPLGFKTFFDVLQATNKITNNLKQILIDEGYSSFVGPEGGYGPNIRSIEETLDLLCRAVAISGYTVSANGSNNTIAFAIDLAANSIYDEAKDIYIFNWPLTKGDKKLQYTDYEISNLIQYLISKYPIISIEDPFAFRKKDQYIKLNKELGGEIQIIGDQLYASNPYLIKNGIEKQYTNSVLIKFDESSTLSQIIESILYVKKGNWTVQLAARNGDTDDTFIADLAVAMGIGQIKIGGLNRGERICKYNRIIEISLEQGLNAVYLGKQVFYNIEYFKSLRDKRDSIKDNKDSNSEAK